MGRRKYMQRREGRHELYSASVYVIQTVGIVEHV